MPSVAIDGGDGGGGDGMVEKESRSLAKAITKVAQQHAAQQHAAQHTKPPNISTQQHALSLYFFPLVFAEF
jgi:hypothetical protein